MKKPTFSRPYLLLLCAAPFLFSCKKDNDTLKTPAERILGKWNAIRETEIRYDYTTGNFLDSNSIAIKPGLFTLDFRTDNKIYITADNGGGSALERDTVGYVLKNDSTFMVSDDQYDLLQFTNNHLIMRDYYDDNSANVDHRLELVK